ncbi:hypothetical protein BASA81_001251 [Batrachochytrium salamandrivorans]|nr:hypothetical protein BASA81_001251 [Batrachochytrium salamandrivorans]
MSFEDFMTTMDAISGLPQAQKEPLARLLFKSFQTEENQLTELKEDKDRQLAQLIKDKTQQLAELKATKDQMIAFQSTRLAQLDAELLVAKSLHAAVLTMRPVLEIYVSLIYKGRLTMTAGLKELVSSCIVRQGSKITLNDAAHEKMQALEGRDVAGVAKALDDLMNLLSTSHHHPSHKVGFVCGGDLPFCVATGIALATAQEMLVATGNLNLANFEINYCNDAWQVTRAFNDGTIRTI